MNHSALPMHTQAAAKRAGAVSKQDDTPVAEFLLAVAHEGAGATQEDFHVVNYT